VTPDGNEAADRDVSGAGRRADSGASEIKRREQQRNQREEAKLDFISRRNNKGELLPGSIERCLKNGRLALLKLGLTFEFDDFAQRALVQGHLMQEFAQGISDKGFSLLRGAVMKEFGFDPGDKNVVDAVMMLCYENSYHPVRYYLGGLVWDGVPRIKRMFTTYFGARDTLLTRRPGTKFDTMVILEGAQGIRKSMAVRVLAGDKWFSDADLLTEPPKERALKMMGVWLYEIGELKGFSNHDLAALKAFMSNQEDKARPPYGRAVQTFPRQCIFIGTTNPTDYLRDPTGNRRFLPIVCGRIDVEALARDRDQLWAEASVLEARGAKVYLPDCLTHDATTEQDKRLEADPWEDLLTDVQGETYRTADGKAVQRVPSAWLLLEKLKIAADRNTPHLYTRLSNVMRRLGWRGPGLLTFGKESARGYERDEPADR